MNISQTRRHRVEKETPPPSPRALARATVGTVSSVNPVIRPDVTTKVNFTTYYRDQRGRVREREREREREITTE